jgi:cytochrome b561
MQWKSSPDRYGALPIVIHWISALAVLIMLASGLTASGVLDAGTKLNLLRLHVLVAVCIFILTVLRIVWWVFIDRKPAPVAGMPRWQKVVSRIVHYGLYFVIIVMLTSGLALAALSGLFPLLLGAPGPLPDFKTFPPINSHGLGAWALTGLALLHIVAALYHHFGLRDRLLTRMGVGA